MDYGSAAAWLISFTLYVQHKSSRHCRCPSWDSVFNDSLWPGSAIQCLSPLCNQHGKSSLCCLSRGGNLQYFLPAHALFKCIKAEPGGSSQMLNGCFVLSSSGHFCLKVISRESHVTTHFDITAYRCGWQIRERGSPVNIWMEHRVAILFITVIPWLRDHVAYFKSLNSLGPTQLWSAPVTR